MKNKKIIVLGFMGGCPIAVVIWQHIHYIVGLQRLGHEVFYVEDTGNFPYNPSNFDISDDFGYATQILEALAKEHGFEGKWAYCARYREPFAMAGMERATLQKLYRECDAALNICGSHDFARGTANHHLPASFNAHKPNILDGRFGAVARTAHHPQLDFCRRVQSL